MRARGGQEDRVAVPVRARRPTGSADADVQRSAVPAPVERQRVPAVLAELRYRAADARGELHTRGDRGQHGYRAEQHVPAAAAHGPEAVQHDRLPDGMAHFGMVEGAYATNSPLPLTDLPIYRSDDGDSHGLSVRVSRPVIAVVLSGLIGSRMLEVIINRSERWGSVMGSNSPPSEISEHFLRKKYPICKFNSFF